jgi:excisionase family DNA binding protein
MTRDIENELSVSQVARILRIDPKTVRRYIDQGKIVAHRERNSGKIVVMRAEVDRHLEPLPVYVPEGKEGLSGTSGVSVS